MVIMNTLEASEKDLISLASKVTGFATLLKDAIIAIQKAKNEFQSLRSSDDGYASNKDEISNISDTILEETDTPGKGEVYDKSNCAEKPNANGNAQQYSKHSLVCDADDGGFIEGEVVGSLTKQGLFWFKPKGINGDNFSLDRFEAFRRMQVQQLIRRPDPAVGEELALQDIKSNSWVRGMVEWTNPNKANEIRVRCVDNGELVNISVNFVYQLPDELKLEPYMALPCCLFKDMDSELPYEARWMFTDNVTGRVMKLRSRDQCQINGITVNVVDLFSEDEKVDVNEQVLSKVKEYNCNQEMKLVSESKSAGLTKKLIADDKRQPYTSNVNTLEQGYNCDQHKGKEPSRSVPGIIRLHDHSIEIDQLHALLLQRDPQFVIVKANYQRIIQGIQDRCFYLNKETMNEINRKFESLVKEHVFFIVVKTYKRREEKKESKQICAVGLVTSEIYTGMRPRTNSYCDKVNMAYISSSKLSASFTGAMRSGYKLTREQGIKYIEQIIQELVQRSAEPLDTGSSFNNQYVLSKQSKLKQIVAEQPALLKTGPLSAILPTMESQCHSQEYDWDEELSAMSQGEGRKSSSSSRVESPDVEILQMTTLKEIEEQYVAPWKVAAAELECCQIKKPEPEFKENSEKLQLRDEMEETSSCSSNVVNAAGAIYLENSNSVGEMGITSRKESLINDERSKEEEVLYEDPALLENDAADGKVAEHVDNVNNDVKLTCDVELVLDDMVRDQTFTAVTVESAYDVNSSQDSEGVPNAAGVSVCRATATESENVSYVNKIYKLFDEDNPPQNANSTKLTKEFLEAMRLKYNQIMSSEDVNKNRVFDESWCDSDESVVANSTFCEVNSDIDFVNEDGDFSKNIVKCKKESDAAGIDEKQMQKQGNIPLNSSNEEFGVFVSNNLNQASGSDIEMALATEEAVTFSQPDVDISVEKVESKDTSPSDKEKKPDRLLYKILARPTKSAKSLKKNTAKDLEISKGSEEIEPDRGNVEITLNKEDDHQETGDKPKKRTFKRKERKQVMREGSPSASEKDVRQENQFTLSKETSSQRLHKNKKVTRFSSNPELFNPSNVKRDQKERTT